MDKYEYNLKLEEIDKLVDQKDYTEAARLADTIDWKRVRNVRTLCLISEIYEAADRLEDSKVLLQRAYRRSPNGRTILYRLTEVTTGLRQYDEAMEYYTEYVQAAPHDNNRYILKYRIYRGRGASAEELIPILEEYLGQEYTEKWAYELAKLYQKAGQTQKCLAACDDLVLWFHSGKYVRRALELKKRYAALTPKQQQLYDQLEEEEENPVPAYTAEDPIPVSPDQQGKEEQPQKEVPDTEAPVKDAESSVEKEDSSEQAEKPDAGEETPAGRTAAVSEPEQEQPEEKAAEKIPAELKTEETVPEETVPQESAPEEKVPEEKVPQESAPEETVTAETVPAEKVPEEKKPEEKKPEEKQPGIPAEAPVDHIEAPVQQLPLSAAEILEAEIQKTRQAVAESIRQAETKEPENEKPAQPEAEKDLQLELAKSMREIISGVVRKEEEEEEPDYRVQEPVLQEIPAVSPAAPDGMPEAQLSIDDVLISMGERGRELARNYSKSAPAGDENENPGRERRGWNRDEALRRMTLTEAAKEGLTDAEREALKYTSDPEKALRSRKNLPSYQEEGAGNTIQGEVKPPEEVSIREDDLIDSVKDLAKEQEEPESLSESLQKTRRFENLRENGKNDILSMKTREIPVEDISRKRADRLRRLFGKGEDAGKEEKPEEAAAAAAEEAVDAMTPVPEEKPERETEKAEEQKAGKTEKADTENKETTDGKDRKEESAPAPSEDKPDNSGKEEPGKDVPEKVSEKDIPLANDMLLPDYQRYLFAGFTEVKGLEAQIQNAVELAAERGEDRTSRTGNILILGPHSSGKTTLAMNIAKAVAQERGEESMKVARIYAADFNRKDIASTIAKVAGGTLIIEEAGDLDASAIDQLTTAMEFRTNGLLVILEDEQQYLHELLMSHPRFTMKFTAQIYIPVYTPRELLNFAQLIAGEKGCVISDDGEDAVLEKISQAAERGSTVTLTDLSAIVDSAVQNSGRFFRKLSMGKKRYDENDYIILFAKDFR